MRRFIPLLIVVSVVGAFVVSRHFQPSSGVARVTAPAPAPLPSPAQPVSAPAAITAVAPSLSSLESRYLGAREDELKSEIEKSKSRLSDPVLTQKGDAGQLNVPESALVLTEIRRQHVLSRLLVKKQIESLKRTAL